MYMYNYNIIIASCIYVCMRLYTCLYIKFIHTNINIFLILMKIIIY